MSEGVVIALIGAAATIVAAVIGLWVKASSSSKTSPLPVRSSPDGNATRKPAEMSHDSRITREPSPTVVDVLECVGRRLQEKYAHEPIPRAELVRQVAAECACSEGSVLPSDHCYNLYNDGLPTNHRPMFVQEGSGCYRFLGPGYRYTGPRFHYPRGGPRRQVGEWIDGKYSPAAG